MGGVGGGLQDGISALDCGAAGGNDNGTDPGAALLSAGVRKMGLRGTLTLALLGGNATLRGGVELVVLYEVTEQPR